MAVRREESGLTIKLVFICVLFFFSLSTSASQLL